MTLDDVVTVLQRSPDLLGWSIERFLGAGGMGGVYLAVHGQTREQRALKVMLPEIAVHSEAHDLFRREIATSRALVHPNIVRTFDAGQVDTTHYLFMEYCELGSLHDYVADGPLEMEDALGIVADVLDGLEYTHSARAHVDQRDREVRGFVHRDLKPQNVLLTQIAGQRTAKVCDFGLAKAFELAGMSKMTKTGMTGGTPAFMCRQQALNYKYSGPEVDVWASAATLYYALTGHAPRELPSGQNAFAQFRALFESSPVPICDYPIVVPPHIAEVIDEALDDEDELRFKTIDQFRQALNDASSYP